MSIFSPSSPPSSSRPVVEGAPSPSRTIDLHISGMSCAACSTRLERVLGRLPGVLSASVNLATERAHVDVDPTRVRTEDLVGAVVGAGFGAHPLEAASPVAEDAASGGDLWVFGLSAALTVPLIWDMVAHMSGLPGHVAPLWQLVLASAVQFGPGLRFYRGAWRALKGGSGTMDTLVALGTTAAWGLSAARVVTDTVDAGLYFESAAVVITLVLLGKALELRARHKAASAIRALMALRPPIAHREVEGGIEDIDAALLRPGDRVVVRGGEALPADGVIEEGTGAFDESLLTGESLPQARGPGDTVIGGAVLSEGLVWVRVQAAGDQAVLARLIRLVESAQAAKAPVQRLVDKIAGIFVPVVIAVAAVTFAVWAWGLDSMEMAISAALSVVVVACPCALGLATPTAVMVGTGLAARRGILIRDTSALERAFQVRTVVFDKTGTLTLGRPVLVHVATPTPLRETAWLRLAAATQGGSAHPLARAFRDAAEERGLSLPDVGGFLNEPGLGVTAVVEGTRVWLGSQRYMAALGADLQGLEADAARFEDQGASAVWMATAPVSEAVSEAAPEAVSDPASEAACAQVVAVFALADPPRPGLDKALERLRALGVSLVMLTGDGERVARAIGEPLGLEDRRWGVPPDGKAAVVRALRQDGAVVAMVGDGVNDAPALAEADVGIAMGGGADAAMETAGMTLMRPDPALVAEALSLSRATVRRIRSNLFWAFGYNVVALPLAAAGILSPMIAGAAMALSSVSVVASSLWLRRWRPE